MCCEVKRAYPPALRLSIRDRLSHVTGPIMRWKSQLRHWKCVRMMSSLQKSHSNDQAGVPFRTRTDDLKFGFLIKVAFAYGRKEKIAWEGKWYCPHYFWLTTTMMANLQSMIPYYWRKDVGANRESDILQLPTLWRVWETHPEHSTQKFHI